MRIFDNMQDADNDRDCYSSHGNETFILTKEEIQALLDGKVLADPDQCEYGTFITIERY